MFRDEQPAIDMPLVGAFPPNSGGLMASHSAEPDTGDDGRNGSPGAPSAGYPGPTQEMPTVRSTVYASSPTTGSSAAGSSAVEPSAVEPRAVEPSAVEPSAVEPSAVEPSAVEPSAVEPPTAEPPTAEPPTAEPSPTAAPGSSVVLMSEAMTTEFRVDEILFGPAAYRGRRRRSGQIGIPIAIVAFLLLGVAGVVMVSGSWPLSTPAASGYPAHSLPPAPAPGVGDDQPDGSPGVGPSASGSASASPKPSASASASASSRPPTPTPTPTRTPSPSPTNSHTVIKTYEAESSQNTATCTSITSYGSATIVTNIGKGCALTFNKINVAAKDKYTVTFFYAAPGADRTLNLRINGAAAISVNAPGTPNDGATIGTLTLQLDLVAGDNSIMWSNDSGNAWAPRSDKITVR